MPTVHLERHKKPTTALRQDWNNSTTPVGHGGRLWSASAPNTTAGIRAGGWAERAPVRHDGVGVVAAGLDEGEDVVPAPAVEPRAVLPQLVQELVHLEGCWQGLNQAGGLHTGSSCLSSPLLLQQSRRCSRAVGTRCASLQQLSLLGHGMQEPTWEQAQKQEVGKAWHWGQAFSRWCRGLRICGAFRVSLSASTLLPQTGWLRAGPRWCRGASQEWPQLPESTGQIPARKPPTTLQKVH